MDETCIRLKSSKLLFPSESSTPLESSASTTEMIKGNRSRAIKESFLYFDLSCQSDLKASREEILSQHHFYYDFFIRNLFKLSSNII